VLNNKHVPDQYLWASQEQRLELLRGLMDTDGCCNKDGQVEFWNMNERLARGVYRLAASLGVKPFWCEGRATLYGKDCGTKFGVKWTAKLECFHLKRKVKRLPENLRATQQWRYIVAVEPAGPREMRCITTSNPSGLYLFGDNFNVTHNTFVLVADFASPGGTELVHAMLRLGNNVLGCVIALAATFLLWPTREPAKLRDRLSTAISTHLSYLSASVGRIRNDTLELERLRRAAGLASNNAEEVVARLRLEHLETPAIQRSASTALALLRRMAGTATRARFG